MLRNCKQQNNLLWMIHQKDKTIIIKINWFQYIKNSLEAKSCWLKSLYRLQAFLDDHFYTLLEVRRKRPGLGGLGRWVYLTTLHWLNVFYVVHWGKFLRIFGELTTLLLDMMLGLRALIWWELILLLTVNRTLFFRSHHLCLDWLWQFLRF